jgi:3-oxoacyl-[acyl-carrier-protein] synthase II
LGDALETAAIKSLFGEQATSGKLLVSSTKSMTGHLLGGAGGLEAGITIMALQRQIVPPTTNLDDPDPACDLNYIANKPQTAQVEVALSNSFGFGGTNGALVFRRWPE